MIAPHNDLYGTLEATKGRGANDRFRPDQTDAEQPDPRNTGGALAVIDQPSPSSAALVVPRVIADLGEHATLRFVDFFTANIRNPNTRAAYAVAMRGFFTWLSNTGRPISPASAPTTSRPMSRSWPRRYKAPTVKQHLAAIRMLFD